MERCLNCHQEMQPGFDFCHHCGASAQKHEVAAPARSKLVELVDDVEQIVTRSAAARSTADQVVSDWLGSPTSVQRRVAYALLTGLAITLAAGSTPTYKPFRWLEGWLVLSIILLPWISYWTTGFIPFSNIVNKILGDVLSLRRRLLITFIWTAIPSLVVLGSRLAIQVGLADQSVIRTLAASFLSMVGIFLIVFYLMGHATVWRSISNLEGSIFLDRMAQDADQISALIRDQIRDRDIQDLQLTEVEMARLRRYTAGESSGRRGRQLSFTRGRTQVVLFVQDFGNSLFIRWVGNFDASGRRLWVFIGLILSGMNNLIWRWTGTNFPSYWRAYTNIWKPSSRSNINFSDLNRAGILSRFFGMVEGVSDYGWNELYALEASIKDTVVKVAQDVQADHLEVDAIQAQLAIQAQVERHGRFDAGNGLQNQSLSGPE